jgi:hypothetical protein
MPVTRAVRTIVVLAVVMATRAIAGEPVDRDWRVWPFSRTSPWNYPIGSGAEYVDVPVLATLPVALNFDDRWTCAVAIADAADPPLILRFAPATGPDSTATFLLGGGKTCGNGRSVEQTLLASSAVTLAYPGNYYSTLATPDTHVWTLPTDYHHADRDLPRTLRMPRETCPSPDTDAMLALVQPDGWILESYATVVTSDGTVLSTMASVLDARGEGTGWWNGRHASMLPAIAGLIRTGELASGRIRHALAVQMPRTVLTTVAVWPAATFDRDAGYSGTLPMGALLAVPPDVDVTSLGLAPSGLAIARAAQDYGVYVVDRGGGGINFLAEAGNPEIRWTDATGQPASWHDLKLIGERLKWVHNNATDRPGGGGMPRAPFAPPFRATPPTLISVTPPS